MSPPTVPQWIHLAGKGESISEVARGADAAYTRGRLPSQSLLGQVGMLVRPKLIARGAAVITDQVV
jgi:hypothetical protein